MSKEATVEPKVSTSIAQERKKPRLLSIVFCDFASFTKEDKTNLLGIFDRVFVHPEVKQTPRFVLFVRTAETIEDQIQVTAIDPQGNVNLGFSYGGEKHEFTPNLPAQMQLVIDVQFIASIEGLYWFDVSYKGKSLGGAGLVVEYRQMEEKEGGTDTYI